MRESCEIIVVAILKRWSCRQLKLCLRKRDRQFVIQLFSKGRLNVASVAEGRSGGACRRKTLLRSKPFDWLSQRVAGHVGSGQLFGIRDAARWTPRRNPRA